MKDCTKKLAVYVLNLERSKTRWEFVSAHLKKNGIDPIRVEAVDGKQLRIEDKTQFYDQAKNNKYYFWPLKDSEIGCYLSHRRAMQAFFGDENFDYLLLLEDDVETDLVFSDNINQWLNVVDKDTPTCLKLFAKRAISGEVVDEVSGVKIIRPNQIPLGCVAQLLNKAAAKKFLDFSQFFYKPIDVDHQFWWQHSVDVLCTERSVFREVSQNLGGTNIGGSVGMSISKKVKREFGRSWFRLKLSVTSHFYRRLTNQDK